MAEQSLAITKDFEIAFEGMTTDEREIVRNLLTTTKPLNEVIPDDISAFDLSRNLMAACKGKQRTEWADSRIKLWLGRMLVVARNCPELWQGNYKDFDDFMTTGVPKLFGVSRNEGFKVKKIIEELSGSLSMNEMQGIGLGRLNAAATAIRKKTPEGTPDYVREKTVQTWVERAKNNTIEKLNEFMVAEQVISQGDADATCTVMFELKKDVYEKFKVFRDQEWVTSKCGGRSDNRIIEAMLSECSSWEAEFYQEGED
jgi:hypothetical protein